VTVILDAEFPRDFAVVRRLFRSYADSLDISLDFQDFEAEVETLPGKYARPRGRLLLAWREAEAIGCVALRAVSDRDCEMKRLYVCPEVRGEHIGRLLAERICDEARQAGYARILLDTLSTMTPALKLYRSLGFEPTEAYVFNPVPGAKFFARQL
jgi:ribosomal protein S18 acetylase RimI-like enzyme